jgi:sporulation-control protein
MASRRYQQATPAGSSNVPLEGLMGFLGQVGAAVGIGAADVEVALERPAYHWDDLIRGQVRVQGGSVDQNATELTVCITEHWTEQRRDHRGNTTTQHCYRHYSETRLATNIALPAGTHQQWPFQVRMPNEAALSHEWSVRARMHVPGAVDRHGETKFRALPSRAVMGLAHALREAAPLQPKSGGNRGSEVWLDFAPADEIRHALDGVKLIVRDQGGVVVGVVEVNPQEHSFSDQLKVLVRQDRERHPISFRAAPLVDGAEGPPPQDVITALRQVLLPYLK